MTLSVGDSRGEDAIELIYRDYMNRIISSLRFHQKPSNNNKYVPTLSNITTRNMKVRTKQFVETEH